MTRACFVSMAIIAIVISVDVHTRSGMSKVMRIYDVKFRRGHEVGKFQVELLIPLVEFAKSGNKQAQRDVAMDIWRKWTATPVGSYVDRGLSFAYEELTITLPDDKNR